MPPSVERSIHVPSNVRRWAGVARRFTDFQRSTRSGGQSFACASAAHGKNARRVIHTKVHYDPTHSRVKIEHMNWEVLAARNHFCLRRAGRYLLAELAGGHLVLSTSFRNGGQQTSLRFIVNHQS